MQNKQALYEKKRAIKEKRADGKQKQKQQQLPIAKRDRGRQPALLTKKEAEREGKNMAPDLQKQAIKQKRKTT